MEALIIPLQIQGLLQKFGFEGFTIQYFIVQFIQEHFAAKAQQISYITIFLFLQSIHLALLKTLSTVASFTYIFLQLCIALDNQGWVNITIIEYNSCIDNQFVLDRMFMHKPQQTIQKSFKRYCKKSGRISFQLKELTQLLKIAENFNHLLAILKNMHTVPQMFKILILINRLLLQKPRGGSVMSQLISNLKWSASGQLQQLLQKKLIIPYKLFLQKRAVAQINSYYGTTPIQCEVRVYQLINLLTIGTSFTDIIYTFGRYYADQYGWAIDFNITIGADLQIIYKNMVDNVMRPAPKALLEEIQVLHEKLYVVFYNCYFHKYLKHYVPKWVITDIPVTPRKDTANKSTRSNSTSKVSYTSLSKTRSTSIKSKKGLNSSYNNQSMAQSCLFLNNPVQEVVENIELQDDIFEEKQVVQKKIEQRFKLLQSMERVVSMFAQ